MSNLTDRQRETLRFLYDKYKLTKDDVFQHKNFTIITRSGIETIAAQEGITVNFDDIRVDTFPYFREVEREKNGIKYTTVETTLATHITILASGSLNGRSIKTLSSASPMNTQSTHYVEVAQKRAESRIVLKLVNLYQEGVFGEDENVHNGVSGEA